MVFILLGSFWMVKCKESGSHAALETSGARSQVLSGKISSSWKLWKLEDSALGVSASGECPCFDEQRTAE